MRAEQLHRRLGADPGPVPEVPLRRRRWHKEGVAGGPAACACLDGSQQPALSHARQVQEISTLQSKRQGVRHIPSGTSIPSWQTWRMGNCSPPGLLARIGKGASGDCLRHIGSCGALLDHGREWQPCTFLRMAEKLTRSRTAGQRGVTRQSPNGGHEPLISARAAGLAWR